ncbi:unnamed protein product [Schistocephalus solidus]|uniref:C-type lectin domain-containing protein n=1 Tax=Schistocephalus solidus TaxID=70667 RepID=A0A183TPU7_SCHSO|nr:unnamed protein product [Schistocephalus solidus]
MGHNLTSLGERPELAWAAYRVAVAPTVGHFEKGEDYFTALLPFVSQSAWIGLRMRSNASDWTNAVGVYEWVSTSNRTHQAVQQEPDFGFSNWAASRYLDVGGHPGDIQVGPPFYLLVDVQPTAIRSGI